jgi:hypothetical protein
MTPNLSVDLIADPISANISATNARRFNQVSPACLAEIKIENCGRSPVIVKPCVDSWQKQEAFRFLYEIYVEREKLVSPFKLPPKCVASRRKWDKWDRRPSTRHIVAISEGEVIGHVRLLYRKDGRLPLEENGFSISSDPDNECEVSKLTLHPDFRHSDILAAFYWHIFHICRTEQRLTGVIFSSQPKHEPMYARIGAVPIGSFMNTELDTPCTVMRITFVDTYGPQFGGSHPSL